MTATNTFEDAMDCIKSGIVFFEQRLEHWSNLCVDMETKLQQQTAINMMLRKIARTDNQLDIEEVHNVDVARKRITVTLVVKS